MNAMRLCLILMLLLLGQGLRAQNDQGAMKTQDGFLLYFNQGVNSHTLELKGQVEFHNFPLIKEGNVWFQFYTAQKSTFGEDGKSILLNYMKWEIDYIHDQMKKNVEFDAEFIVDHGRTLNLWKYNNPVYVDDKGKSFVSVKSTYVVDFIHNDLIYRFNYSSASDNKLEARNILLKKVNDLKFYNSDINLAKLSEEIVQGKK